MKCVLLAVFEISCLGMSTAALAQSALAPAGQYPELRTLSGLSGGGFGVRPDGTPSFDGAMAMSTPIGYSLSNWHFAGIASNTSDNSFFRFPHLSKHSGNDDSMGKLAGIVGIPLGKFGSVSGTVILDSSVGDFAENIQYQAPTWIDHLGISIGNDLAGRRGTGAEGVTGGSADTQSWFFSGTYALPHGIYATLGGGTQRFSKGFFNVSAPFAPHFKVVFEHDGFNFNEAIAYNAGPLKFLKVSNWIPQSTIMVGYVKTQYAFISYSLTF